MSDLRARIPAQALMQRTLNLHPPGFYSPGGEVLPWYTGALGEISVAGVLSWLGPEWTVLHSVPVGRGDSDIDHVVIGPPGVFTLNTKSHVGKDIWIGGHGLLVAGQKTHYIGNAISEAARAEKLLSAASGLTVPVTPVIVFVNPGQRTVKATPEGGVRIVADWELLDMLQGRAEFSDEQVRRIADSAAQGRTWHQAPAPEVDTRKLAIQFNALMARAHQGAAPTLASTQAPVSDLAAPSAAKERVPRPRARTASTRTSRLPSPTRAAAPRSRRSRKKFGVGALLLKLAGIGFMLWFLNGVFLPGLLSAVAP